MDAEVSFGVSRIATMKYLGPMGYYAGSSARSFSAELTAPDIRSLTDLKNKTFMAVDEISCGG